MHGLENHPTLTAKVVDDIGREHTFLVKVILPNEAKAYALFDKVGNPTSLTFQSNGNNSFAYVGFNGLWIENEEVTSLDILTKQKHVYIGKLISLSE